MLHLCAFDTDLKVVFIVVILIFHLLSESVTIREIKKVKCQF